MKKTYYKKIGFKLVVSSTVKSSPYPPKFGRMDCGGWRGLDFFKFHGGEKSLILSAKHYMILSVAGVSYSVQVIFQAV